MSRLNTHPQQLFYHIESIFIKNQLMSNEIKIDMHS